MGNAFGSNKLTEAAASSSSSSSSEPAAAPEGMDDEVINGIMTENGPIITAIVLKPDGSVQEVTIDMTPREQNVKKLIGGVGVTFVGSWDDGETVAVRGVFKEESGAPVSSHALPFPHHEVGLVGDTVLYRTSEQGLPMDLTLAGYESLRSRPVSREDRAAFEAEKRERLRKEFETALAAGSGDDEDKNGDGNDEVGDEDDEEDGAYDSEDAERDDVSSGEEEEEEGEEMDEESSEQVSVLMHVVQAFTDQHGRAPTMEEIKETLRSVAASQALEAQQEGAEGAESSGDEDEDEDEEGAFDPDAVLSGLVAEFEDRHGRGPTEDELAQWRDALSSAGLSGGEGEESSAAPAATPAKAAPEMVGSGEGDLKSPDTVVAAVASPPATGAWQKKRKELPAGSAEAEGALPRSVISLTSSAAKAPRLA